MADLYYDSSLTGEELDTAFKKVGSIDQSVQEASQHAATAKYWAEQAAGSSGFDPTQYYTKTQTDEKISENPPLYVATFRVNGWSGSTGNYYQTVSANPVNGSPTITSSSVMLPGLACDDSVQGEAQAELLEAASIIDRGYKTLGYGTITCRLSGDKPTADAEVYFMARKG